MREILETQVPSLFGATEVFPGPGQDEVMATIRQMEENIGMDADQASRIRETLRKLDGPAHQKIIYHEIIP